MMKEKYLNLFLSEIHVRNENLMCFLYKTYVLPIIDYGCILFNFRFRRSSDAIEKSKKYFIVVYLRVFPEFS